MAEEKEGKDRDANGEPPETELIEGEALPALRNREEGHARSCSREGPPALGMLLRLLGVEERCADEAQRAHAREEEDARGVSADQDVREGPQADAPEERIARDAHDAMDDARWSKSASAPTTVGFGVVTPTTARTTPLNTITIASQRIDGGAIQSSSVSARQ